MKKIEDFVDKHSNKIFIFICLIFAIILFYKLGVIPEGLHVDEAGMAYDAMNLAQNGTDRYLNKIPVYLINFGGGQSALYAYLTAILLKIFTMSSFIIRLPQVLLSISGLIFLYKLLKENNGNKMALIASFIYAIIPWNIMRSRWGLDAYLLASMLIISLYFFIHSINIKKNYMFIISGILFGITLYTYILSYVIIVVLLVVLIIYYLYLKEISFKQIIIFGLPLFIIALPLILMVGYNSGIIPKVKLPFVSIPDLWFYRGSEFSIQNIKINLDEILDILFIKDILGYNSIEKFGTLYKISIPVVIFGITFSVCDLINDIKNKKTSLDLAMLTIFVTTFTILLLIIEPNINKANAIYIPMIYFIAKAIVFICERFKPLYFIMIIIYLFNFISFTKYYFTEYAKEWNYLFEKDILDATNYAETLDKDTVYIENCLNQTYIYTLIENKLSAEDFAKTVKIENFIVTEYSNYKFYYSSEIDEEGVYLLKYDNNKYTLLLENGFKDIVFGDFHVLYYED